MNALAEAKAITDKYAALGEWERTCLWLLDQARIEDTFVYFIHADGGGVAVFDIPGWGEPGQPKRDSVLRKLVADGRIKFRTKKGWRLYDLTPHSGIEGILGDLAFLRDMRRSA